MSNLLFCLQMCPVDADAAFDLARLVCDIERIHPTKDKPSWIISHRLDTPISRVYNMQAFLARAFGNQVWVRPARYHAAGWPAGANALWRSAMEEVSELTGTKQIRAEGVFTFEPDCVPLELDWIERLQAAYAARQKPIVGNFHGDGEWLHVNGNSIFPVDLARDWPHVLRSPVDTAWDFYHRQFLVANAEDTNLITQYYRRRNLTASEWPGIQKNGQRPVVLHGVKDVTARRLARVHLLRSQFLEPPAKRGLQRSVQA